MPENFLDHDPGDLRSLGADVRLRSRRRLCVAYKNRWRNVANGGLVVFSRFK